MSLQFSYAFLGGAMNYMSLLHFRRKGRYYTPTSPITGIALMVIFVILISLGGGLKHLLAVNSESYLSESTRWSALAINIYGVCLSTYSIVRIFRL